MARFFSREWPECHAASICLQIGVLSMVFGFLEALSRGESPRKIPQKKGNPGVAAIPFLRLD